MSFQDIPTFHLKAPAMHNHGRLLARPCLISRRHMFQLAAAGAVGLVLDHRPIVRSVCAAAADPPKSFEPLNRFPRAVQEYFVRRVREVEATSLKAKGALSTRAEAEAYVCTVREKIHQSFGPLPEKTPLNARTTGVVDRDTYRIEKVVFESRPELLVTANLYVPKGRTFPLPGVVAACGHSVNGKCAEAYQSFAQGLARMGYVVLIYDPIGQGERLQYPTKDFKSRIGVGVAEHLYCGNPQFLVGEFFGAWRAWDGIRALDYLLTREEVDPKHVGVTGNSGGGTLTTWLCGVEQRWTMAAPACFVTTFLRNLENELPADTEQCPPKALALGLDHDDFLAALAPKPIIILAKEQDYFDVRGSEEALRRLRHLYGLLGAEDNIALHVGPTTHGYTQENREAMYRWFNRVTGVSDAQTEPKLVIEKDETLWCTPKGQVCELGSRPVYSFTKAISQGLSAARKKLRGADLASAVADVLRMPERPKAPPYRILRPARGRKHPMPHFTTYALQSEPGAMAVVYLLGEEPRASRPPRGRERAVLYVAHLSSDAELREEPLVRELIEAEPQSAFYTCDVRGIGESRPNTCGADFFNPYGPDYFYAIHAIMLDEPYLGRKTHDVLSVIDFLGDCGHREVHLVGKGWAGLPATFAAVLSDRVTQVTLKNALTSYAAIAEGEDYDWPLSTFAPGILHRFDLADCYEELAAKKLRQIEPWGAQYRAGS